MRTVLKCIIAGDGAVGKSTIAKRLCGKLTDDINIEMTKGLDIEKFEIEKNDNEKIVIQLWDMGGQEQFRVFQKDFFEGAHLVIFVYSLTWFHSFLHLNDWIRLISERKPPLKGFVIANKIDLPNRAIASKEGEDLAFNLGYDYYEVSSLTGMGFDEFKEGLVSSILFMMDNMHRISEKIIS